MSHNPEDVITVKWTEACRFDQIRLGDLHRWMRANPGLANAMPVATTSVEGKHFLAPCILANTPEVAVLLGVPLGDGRTYATQRQAARAKEDINAALGRASLPLLGKDDLQWMLSPATSIAVTQPAAAQAFAESVEEVSATIFG
jgi:hypothetical protein